MVDGGALWDFAIKFLLCKYVFVVPLSTYGYPMCFITMYYLGVLLPLTLRPLGNPKGMGSLPNSMVHMKDNIMSMKR
jgi:hypothetical protein